MTEVLQVIPAPPPEVVRQLAPPTLAHVRFEYGEDARGRSRLGIYLTHEDEDVLADARNTWMRTLASAGHQAFLV